jgi:hypothetical protein
MDKAEVLLSRAFGLDRMRRETYWYLRSKGWEGLTPDEQTKYNKYFRLSGKEMEAIDVDEYDKSSIDWTDENDFLKDEENKAIAACSGNHDMLVEKIREIFQRIDNYIKGIKIHSRYSDILFRPQYYLDYEYRNFPGSYPGDYKNGGKYPYAMYGETMPWWVSVFDGPGKDPTKSSGAGDNFSCHGGMISDAGGSVGIKGRGNAIITSRTDRLKLNPKYQDDKPTIYYQAAFLVGQDDFGKLEKEGKIGKDSHLHAILAASTLGEALRIIETYTDVRQNIPPELAGFLFEGRLPLRRSAPPLPFPFSTPPPLFASGLVLPVSPEKKAPPTKKEEPRTGTKGYFLQSLSDDVWDPDSLSRTMTAPRRKPLFSLDAFSQTPLAKEEPQTRSEIRSSILSLPPPTKEEPQTGPGGSFLQTAEDSISRTMTPWRSATPFDKDYLPARWWNRSVRQDSVSRDSVGSASSLGSLGALGIKGERASSHPALEGAARSSSEASRISADSERDYTDIKHVWYSSTASQSSGQSSSSAVPSILGAPPPLAASKGAQPQGAAVAKIEASFGQASISSSAGALASGSESAGMSGAPQQQREGFSPASAQGLNLGVALAASFGSSGAQPQGALAANPLGGNSSRGPSGQTSASFSAFAKSLISGFRSAGAPGAQPSQQRGGFSFTPSSLVGISAPNIPGAQPQGALATNPRGGNSSRGPSGQASVSFSAFAKSLISGFRSAGVPGASLQSGAATPRGKSPVTGMPGVFLPGSISLPGSHAVGATLGQASVSFPAFAQPLTLGSRSAGVPGASPQSGAATPRGKSLMTGMPGVIGLPGSIGGQSQKSSWGTFTPRQDTDRKVLTGESPSDRLGGAPWWND